MKRYRITITTEVAARNEVQAVTHAFGNVDNLTSEDIPSPGVVKRVIEHGIPFELLIVEIS